MFTQSQRLSLYPFLCVTSYYNLLNYSMQINENQQGIKSSNKLMYYKLQYS